MKHVINDTDKNKFEAYDKTEVLAAIQEAISSGELPEEINGLVITLKNPIDNQGYKIAFCTQAKYNELEANEQLEVNCYYFITDDSTFDDWNTIITDLQTRFNQLEADVEEAIETGLRPRITSIECSLNFHRWNSYTSRLDPSDDLSLKHVSATSSYEDRRVNILPTGSNQSIAEARVDYVSGDNGYLTFDLETINQNVNYIDFTARSLASICNPNCTDYSPTVERTTTFRIYIKDIYGTELTKEFTINYKSIGS